jgi:hypothetical protein
MAGSRTASRDQAGKAGKHPTKPIELRREAALFLDDTLLRDAIKMPVTKTIIFGTGVVARRPPGGGADRPQDTELYLSSFNIGVVLTRRCPDGTRG